jgi:hypothetical protein
VPIRSIVAVLRDGLAAIARTFAELDSADVKLELQPPMPPKKNQGSSVLVNAAFSFHLSLLKVHTSDGSSEKV